ncbi:transcription initiation factor TFIID subunit 11 [Coemansia javaensis]|uniref:Transcription initiation factor TFIID subunit 11 n=1 Tax=Coemansia javaensis TaxID=2761396 RepID=A0A9W8HMW3_9FUNG|nr:transcription initiation factor TFIID subunit 11 [Coemansia javaensis]
MASKKRPRLTALTPVGILRQRKKRGGGPPAPGVQAAAQRRSVSGSRPGAITPAKQPRPASGPSPADSADGRSRRNSTAGADAAEAWSGIPAAVEAAAAAAKDGDADADEGAEPDGDGDGDNDVSIALVRQSKEEEGELWKQMSDEQRMRYGVYRRSALNKATVKRLVSQVLNQQVSSTVTFVVAGFAKVFVGEIVERAVQIQAARGEQGPLLPDHLREAYRLYKKESLAPDSTANGFTKRLF